MHNTATTPTGAHPDGQPEVPVSSPGGVTWRQLRQGLWVGRSDGKPIGMIEHGRRYTFTDLAEHPYPGYRTLAEAQDAATAPILVIPPSPNRTGPLRLRFRAAGRRRAVALAAIPAAAVVGAAFAGGIALAAQFFLA